jgi:glucose-1-phosphate thymidylyltransferase
MRPVVGLIPAAGRALRLGPLPCSKELLPVGFRSTPAGPAPKVACHYLLERFAAAGIDRALFVLHESKWDVARYLTTGGLAGVHLAYVVIPGSGSVAETLSYAAPWVAGETVALGFPDVIFEPVDAYSRLLERQAERSADLVLGLFPASKPSATDMVELGDDGHIRRIEIRPVQTRLRYNWLLAVWTPVFTRFLQQAVALAPAGAGELHFGAVVQAAVEAEISVEGVPFPQGSYRDLGTPDELAAAWQGCDLPRHVP